MSALAIPIDELDQGKVNYLDCSHTRDAIVGGIPLEYWSRFIDDSLRAGSLTLMLCYKDSGGERHSQFFRLQDIKDNGYRFTAFAD